MNQIRTDALTAVVDDLAAIEIDWDQYFSDLEPQAIYDTVLTGKIDSLRAFCERLGWSDITTSMHGMTPLRGNALETLELGQSFVIPEARRLLSTIDIDEATNSTDWFWQFVHPRIAGLARPRFEAGFFGDAVEVPYKETNDVVKQIVTDSNGQERDGANLMYTAFSVENPVIQLTTLETETDRNIQQGYMHIMAGSMTGIRNPKAHGNLVPSRSITLHLICLASLLMRKIDERV